MDSEPLKKLIVLKASAGSGKTYHLALEYISLSLLGERDFRQILAITFTNKATKEMKERIVSFLKEISENKNPELIQQLIKKTNLSEKEIQERSFLVLKNILHNYSHFAISTIDSFFQKILRGFTREIGLIGNFELELDYQKVLDYAIDQVIDSSKKNREIKNWILDFVKDKLLAGSSWDIRKDLKTLAAELNSENFKTLEADKEDIIPKHSELSKFISSLKKIKFSFEAAMDKIGKDANDIAGQFNLSVEDFSYGKNGVFNYFNNIRNDTKKYSPGKRALEGCDAIENWHSKSSTKKEVIAKAVQNGLMELLNSALNLYEAQSKEYLTAVAILKNLYALGLFSEIKKAIDEYKNENDVFLLNDTNIFLKGIIEDNETPFIYEKTGSWYSNFLIDEFQDTSKLQWQNLKPLISNSISDGNENLVVGDSKQSIYRWRGGDWELIEKQINNDFSRESMEQKVLDTNWRSSKHIVEFNNYLFEILPQTFEKVYLQSSTDNFQSLSSDFKLVYHDCRQNISQKNLSENGFVQISFSDPKEKEENWKEMSLQWLKLQLQKLQDKGYFPGQIAILTRTKKEGTEVVNFLNEQNKTGSQYRYDVISNESLLIKNFTAIRLIVDSLKYIVDPENELLKANVAVEYYREKNDPASVNSLLGKATFKEKIEQLLPSKFRNDLEKLQKYGLLESYSALIEIFELDKREENFAYLVAMQDVIRNFVNEKGNDISYFLEWWDEEKDQQTLQSPETVDAIKILTIHKSKGLEFDVVIIPFFNWEIDHKSNNVFLWVASNVKPFNEQSIIPLKYQKELGESFFDAQYYNEKHLTFIDNLNLCYVAFTRAKKNLMIHGQFQPINNLRNVSSVLYHSLTDENFQLNKILNKENPEFTYGTLDASIVDQKSMSSKPNHFVQKAWRNKTRLKRRGREYFDKSQKGRKEKIHYGLLVHEILAEIKTAGEASQHISIYQNQGLITKDEVNLLNDQLDRIFANPQVEKWFKGDWEVRSETSILSPNKDELRPDRVLICGDQAIIIDFKTGKEEPFHSTQLKNYKNKLLEMGYKNVEAFVLYIQTNKVKQIV